MTGWPPDLTIPSNLYLPLKTGLPANQSQVHLFERTLFPNVLNITTGTTVTWTNLDIRDYTLTSQPVPPTQETPFGTITLHPGDSASYTFNNAGTYTYAYQYVDARPSPTPINQTAYGKIVVTVPKA